MRTTGDGEKQLVPAISRAARVLEFVRDAGPEGATMTDIATGVGLSKSSAFAVVRTMTHEAFLDFDEATRRYVFGPALIELGASAIGRSAPIVQALRHMHQLSEATRLASLAVQRMPDGHFVVVEKVESRQDVKVTIEIGHVAPPDSPILSRLWAAWSDVRIAAHRSYTSTTITDERRIEDLERNIRFQGFAAVYGEYMTNLNAVGVPVFSAAAQPCLAILLLGMGDDLGPDHVLTLAPQLVRTSREVTTSSGGRLPDDYPAQPASTDGGDGGRGERSRATGRGRRAGGAL